jgi:nucleotide-binding universal stress UspA family protein
MSENSPPYLKRVMVCTDDSPASQGAVKAGLWLGEQCGAEVVLLKVIDSTAVEASPENSEARDNLEDLKSQALEAGIALEEKIRLDGSPQEGILAEAKTFRPDWIIMGRKGSTGLRRLLLGSVTARVIGHFSGSVLVVPREAALNLRTILIASDGSADSEAAWREALAIAEGFKSEVIAVSVARDEAREIDCQLILQHLEASAARHGVALQCRLTRGRPFEAISQVAQDEWANLVVMGTRGRTGLARLLMGSVVERVIGMVDCPVLVAKQVRKE